MELDSRLVAALVAAIVSLIVSLISYFATKTKIKNERARLERELQRRVTERLYDLRLTSYPRAFEVTEPILGTKLFSDEGVSKEVLQEVLENLNAWKATEATFIMSKQCNKEFYKIRGVLMSAIDEYDPSDEEKKKKLFAAKNAFRKQLRDDVGLLFEEEV